MKKRRDHKEQKSHDEAALLLAFIIEIETKTDFLFVESPVSIHLARVLRRIRRITSVIVQVGRLKLNLESLAHLMQAPSSVPIVDSVKRERRVYSVDCRGRA